MLKLCKQYFSYKYTKKKKYSDRIDNPSVEIVKIIKKKEDSVVMEKKKKKLINYIVFNHLKMLCNEEEIKNDLLSKSNINESKASDAVNDESQTKKKKKKKKKKNYV